MENQIFDLLTSRVVGGQIVRDPFMNNVIPANRIDPIAAKVQAMIPTATNSALINNYAIVDAYTTTKSIPSLKIDQNSAKRQKSPSIGRNGDKTETRTRSTACPSRSHLRASISIGRQPTALTSIAQ